MVIVKMCNRVMKFGWVVIEMVFLNTVNEIGQMVTVICLTVFDPGCVVKIVEFRIKDCVINNFLTVLGSITVH